MARAALRDDVYAVHAQLTAQVLRATGDDEPAPARIASWEEGDAVVVSRAASTLEEICADETGDLAGCRSGCGWSGGCCPRRNSSGRDAPGREVDRRNDSVTPAKGFHGRR